MSPAKSQTTRLLCASAFLAGTQYRERILNHFEHESRGVSPELGVNTRLVVMVCQYARIRARNLDRYLFLVLLASLLFSAIDLVFGIFVFLLTATAVHFKMTYEERVDLVPRFLKENFDEPTTEALFASQLDNKITSALPREDQNLVVYTGFTPFVGAGIYMGGWSFVVDVSKPDCTLEYRTYPKSFTVEELYADVRSGISSSQLEGIAIKDCFFVNGREIRKDRELLPDIYRRPVQCLNHSAKTYQSRSDRHIRHYMWIRIHDWDQELVTSYFLRLSIRGRSLLVEINRFLLTPLQERYRSVDSITPLRTPDLFAMLITSALVGPFHALLTPLILVARWIETSKAVLDSRERTRRRDIERNLLFDYGAGQGPRQLFSSNRFEHYFQKVDGDFYAKALESIILDRIITFLDDHHVDTSDLRERQKVILNSGIIVHGGDVKAESLAVGLGAKAMKSQTQARGDAK